MTTSYVDSNASCARPTGNGQLPCEVKAVRHTKGQPISGNRTSIEGQVAVEILRKIPYTMASSHASEPSILENYLEDPPSAFNVSGSNNSFEDLPLSVFEARLSMVLNTFLRATWEMASLVGMRGTTVVYDAALEGAWVNTSSTWKEHTSDIYEIKQPWYALYMASTLVLAVCALINIVLRSLIRAPDFLGSISALTRDSPFVDGPTSGSAMDGTERTRLLKERFVRIQDVKPEEDVGRIAFGDMKGMEGGLQWSKKYE